MESRNLLTLTNSLFFVLLCGLLAGVPSVSAQIPTAPPGYPQGPFISSVDPSPKKGEVLVKLRPNGFAKFKKDISRTSNPPQSEHVLVRAFAKFLGFRTLSPLVKGSVEVNGRRVNQLKLSRAKQRGYIRFAEPDYKLEIFQSPAEPDDFFYKLNLLWNLSDSGYLFFPPDIDVDAPEAFTITQGNSDVVVVIMDTGLDRTHPDLEQKVWSNPGEVPENGIDDDNNGYIDDVVGWDFVNRDNDPSDDHFHGTHVSGIVAAEGFNGRGTIGVAPGVKVLGLKIMNAQGEGDTADAIRAMEYVITLKQRGVNIAAVNASFGGGESQATFEELLRRLNQAGVLFVAAAGNSSTDNDVDPIYPANYNVPNVVSVAAVDFGGDLSAFSNFGAATVDIAAPGSLIWSPIVKGLYLPFDGTSMSAPHVAGIAALLRSHLPELSPAQMKARILESAKPMHALDGRLKSPAVASAYWALLGERGPPIVQ